MLKLLVFPKTNSVHFYDFVSCVSFCAEHLDMKKKNEYLRNKNSEAAQVVSSQLQVSWCVIMGIYDSIKLVVFCCFVQLVLFGW